MRLSPMQFLVSGFFMVLYGMVMPFLMVMHIVEATFFLSITSYVATFTGLMFGIIGIATYTREHRNRDR